VPLLDEVVSWLSQRGFVSYDICGLTRRPLDNAFGRQTSFFFNETMLCEMTKGILHLRFLPRGHVVRKGNEARHSLTSDSRSLREELPI
jgi:hypothetical protein